MNLQGFLTMVIAVAAICLLPVVAVIALFLTAIIGLGLYVALGERSD